MKFKTTIKLNTWLFGLSWSQRDDMWPFSHVAVHLGPVVMMMQWNFAYRNIP